MAMKKIFLPSLILALLSQLINAQIPTYKWAYSIGDVSQESIETLATDSENNIIIGGSMYGTTDMNPTEFLKILNQIGQQDAFIEKFDKDGNVLWGLNFGGALYDGINKIITDAYDNIYAVGYYRGNVDLNPDMVDQDLVTLHGLYDMFIVKYNKEGEYIWGHGIGGLKEDGIFSIALDIMGNIYVTGHFNGTVDFDGTPAGVMEISSSFDSDDGFLAKYNSDGEISWVFRIGGSDGDFSKEVAVDNDGNIIVTGTFEGTINFGDGFINAADGTNPGWPKEGDAFIAKYNNGGDLIWAKSIVGDDGPNGGYDNSVNSLVIDDDNNIYVTGLIYGKGDFDMDYIDEHIDTSFSDYASYFAKYNSDGDYIWSHTTAPKVIGFTRDMAIDANNDIYLTGNFFYSSGPPWEADFDVHPDSIHALQSYGGPDVFIVKYNSDAQLLWAYNVGGKGYDYGTALAIDDSFNVCVGGWFFESTDFDANPDTNFIWLPYIKPNYGDNAWIGKYHQEGIAHDTTVNQGNRDEVVFRQSVLIYPNPALDKLQLLIEGPSAEANRRMHPRIVIQNLDGKIIKNIPFSDEIDISELAPGMYFIKIGRDIKKFVKL
jgi:hypothetical protein